MDSYKTTLAGIGAFILVAWETLEKVLATTPDIQHATWQTIGIHVLIGVIGVYAADASHVKANTAEIKNLNQNTGVVSLKEAKDFADDIDPNKHV